MQSEVREFSAARARDGTSGQKEKGLTIKKGGANPLLQTSGSPPVPHPTPYTLLHPTPYTLHPSPYNLRPTPYTLHPTPYTLHHTPYTLHPKGLLSYLLLLFDIFVGCRVYAVGCIVYGPHDQEGRRQPAPPNVWLASGATPYTIHHTPHTTHPTPYTLHPAPCTLPAPANFWIPSGA